MIRNSRLHLVSLFTYLIFARSRYIWFCRVYWMHSFIIIWSQSNFAISSVKTSCLSLFNLFVCIWDFFSFLLLINFQKKNLLRDSLVLIPNNPFFFQLLQVWYLCVFSHFFFKTALFTNLKSVLYNHFLLFF